MSEEHDTHGVSGRPWYGFDLDGTLAEYHGWKGVQHIGDPIKPMCGLLLRLRAEGKLVKIVTARVAPRHISREDDSEPGFGIRGREHFGEQFSWECKPDVPGTDPEDWHRVYAHEYINRWCLKNLGFAPAVTDKKDHLMLWLVDDRTVQVEPNTGRVLGRLPEEMLLPHCDDSAALALKEENL